MKNKFRFSAFASLCAILLAASAVHFHGFFLRSLLEFQINRDNREIFCGSIKIPKAEFTPGLGIRIEGLRGGIKTDTGFVPFQIPLVFSENRVTDLFSSQGLLLRFEKFQFKALRDRGVGGTLRLKSGRLWSSELEAEVKSLDLEEFEWLNPENLSGATGELRGRFILKTGADRDPELLLELKVEEPGGTLPSKAFSPLLAYLPESLQREYVRELTSDSGLIRYSSGVFRVDLSRADRMKLFLHMAIPDYNLDINLNLEIRVEEADTFSKIVQLMAHVKGGGVS